MAYIVTLLLAVSAATFVTADSSCPVEVKGVPKERYRLKNVTIIVPPNEYMSEAIPHVAPDGTSDTITTVITKQFPENARVKVNIKYQGEPLPEFDIEICSGMQDPIFVNDVVKRGYPKETFPKECPIIPGEFAIKEWGFPHCKIPPGTPPGPVNVDIYIYIPGQDPIFHLHGDNEIVLDTSDVPEIPGVPAFGK